jgi:hypothetical protein
MQFQQFINKKSERPGIMTLLKGQMGAMINDQVKIKGYKSKLILKTSSAAMGVRGTEFMIAYNQKSNASSLVTFKGSVVMTKNDGTNANDLDKLGRSFNEASVTVKEGEFSGISDKEKDLKTEKVNSDQLALLEKISLAKDEKLAVAMLNENKNIELNNRDGKIIDLQNGKTINSESALLSSNGDVTQKPIVAESPKAAEEIKVVESKPVEVKIEKIKKWYAGVNAGVASSSMDTANINQELTSRGISGKGEVHNSSRFSWRFFLGYDFTKNWSAELSYIDLGKSSTEFTNVSLADAYKLTDLNSISGKGPELKGRYKVHLSEDVAMLAKLGVIHWTNLSAYEATYGYGMEFKAPKFITSKLSDTRLRLDYDFYHLKGNSTHVITAGVAIPFGL